MEPAERQLVELVGLETFFQGFPQFKSYIVIIARHHDHHSRRDGRCVETFLTDKDGSRVSGGARDAVAFYLDIV